MPANIKQRVAAGLTLFEASKAEVFGVRALHEALDTPDEYRTNKTACNGKIQKLALNRGF